jgi:hypothetical protein
MKSFFESWRQSIVGLDMVHKCSIAANFWRVKDDKEGGSRRLLFISDITVPGYGAVAATEESFEF